jgi:hypothetical protein
MSIVWAKAELKRFLESPDPQVMCLRGKWGVGKTFTWSDTLEDQNVVKNRDFTNYSYVSLFGIESLDRLRTSVFENATPIETNKTLARRAGNLLRDNWRKHIRRINEVPTLKDFIPSVEPFLFGSVNKYVVCFDDIERMGDLIQLKDVLGIASYLKDQRGCKVIIILNDDELHRNSSDFSIYFEKVVDTNLLLDPTPEEVSNIAIEDSSPTTEIVRLNIVKLGITNIRVAKKIIRAVLELERSFHGHGPGALRAAAHSATLLGWIAYEPNVAPTIEFINKRSRMRYISMVSDQTEKELFWGNIIDEYNFGTIDKFDEIILKGLKSGYFDETQIKSLAEQIDQRLEKDRIREAFKCCWDEYRSCITATRHEFPDVMHSTAQFASAFISPTELDATVSVLRSFSRDDLASKLIKHYVELPGRSDDFFALDIYSAHEIKDQEIINSFNDRFQPPEDTRNIFEILARMSVDSGWHSSDVSRLADFDEDQYYKELKEYRSPILNQIITFALGLRSLSGPEKLIGDRMATALGRIGAEGKVEARRVRNFGIEPSAAPNGKQDMSASSPDASLPFDPERG